MWRLSLRGEARLSPDQIRNRTQFPLRLANSLREAANALATHEGISLNHFISLAVAEKISRIEDQAARSTTSALGKDHHSRHLDESDVS